MLDKELVGVNPSDYVNGNVGSLVFKASVNIYVGVN